MIATEKVMAKPRRKGRNHQDTCDYGKVYLPVIESTNDDDSYTDKRTGRERRQGFAEEEDERLPLDDIFR